MSYKTLTEEVLKQIVRDSHSWMEVISKCGLKTITRGLQRRLVKYKIDCRHFETWFDGKYTKINRFTKQEISEIVKSNKKWIDIMNAFGYKSCASVDFIKTKLDKLAVDYNHVDQTYQHPKATIPLQQILVSDSDYSSMKLLQGRLKRELGWEHKCSTCKNTEWNGKPIPIQIDHINGDHFDNRIENLRFLCPNCHAQTDTYCGKNMKVCKENKGKVKEKQTIPKKKETQQVVEKPSRHYCTDCNKELKNKSTRCKECDEKNRVNLRKVDRPSYDQLKDDLQQMSMVKVGKKYGVSDNCIRKWLRQYEKVSAAYQETVKT